MKAQAHADDAGRLTTELTSLTSHTEGQSPAVPPAAQLTVWAHGAPLSIGVSGSVRDVRDVKAQVAALTGVPADKQLLFSEAPQPDDTASAALPPVLHLGLGHASSALGHASSQQVSRFHQLLSQQAMLEERDRRMQSAVSLWEQAGSSAAAEAHAAAGCERAEHAALQWSTTLDRAELCSALDSANRERDEALARVSALERELAEQRAAVQAADTAAQMAVQQPTTQMAVQPSGEKVATASVPLDGNVARAMPSGGDKESATALIDAIRREKLLEVPGTSLPPELRGAVGALQGSLHRSLELLAADIYRDDTHCVLELLQNADDNSYTTGVSPCWELHSTVGAVWTVHNEVGLEARDVRGLCDAGASTKKRSTTGGAQSGAIGRKGIGFKSVFKLSDTPH
eukprot:3321-Prymnesium_polylepis.1